MQVFFAFLLGGRSVIRPVFIGCRALEGHAGGSNENGLNKARGRGEDQGYIRGWGGGNTSFNNYRDN